MITYDYTYINQNTAPITPSTIHVQDTALHRFFARYLMQKAISVFKWELPESWDRDFFLTCLYSTGKVVVVNTSKYGVIPQPCELKGYDIFYRPNKALVISPLFYSEQINREYTIGKDCCMFKLMPDYGSIIDCVNYYAGLMALCSEGISMNILNSKLGYVFTAENKAAAESFKKLFDSIASGEVAIVADKRLFSDDGSANWEAFNNSIGSNYIADRLLADMRKIEAMFDTEIGIPNANTDKRERLISDEVNANNVETASRAELWLESLNKTCDDINAMFGIDVKVDWRVNPTTTMVEVPTNDEIMD